MKERGILFSAEMVRKLLSGEKTQTRRVVIGMPSTAFDFSQPIEVGEVALVQRSDNGFMAWPYGYRGLRRPPVLAGDTMWCREAWRTLSAYDDRPPRDVPYGAPLQYLADMASAGNRPLASLGRYRHARFMMRHHARVTRDIASVRLERLHDISEADAAAEGVTLDVGCPCQGDAEEPGPHLPLCRFSFDPWPGETPFDEPRPYARAFAALWVSINGRKSWDEDPWLWVVGFKQVTP